MFCSPWPSMTFFFPCGRLTYYKKHRKPPPEHCLTPHNKPSEKRLIMMDPAFPESSIHVEESEWSQFDLPATDDRHVLAAAAQGQADALATRNIKDFPQKLLDSFSIQVITPDDLLCVLLRRNPEATASAIRELIDSRHRPPISIPDFAKRLERSGATQFAAAIAHIRQPFGNHSYFDQ